MTFDSGIFTLTRPELSILGQTIAPIDIMEEKGGSIWVSMNGKGERTWIVESDDLIVKVVVQDDGANGSAWTHPIPEQMLVAAQRFLVRNDGIRVTLDDERASFSCDAGTMSIPQNRELNPPPIVPLVVGGIVADVHEGGLCAILEAASRRPIGLETGDVDPPMRCIFDTQRGEMELVVDWSIIGSGICRYSVPARFSATTDEPIDFVLPHYRIWMALSHPMAIGEFDRVRIAAPGPDDEYLHVATDEWELFIRALPDVNSWGKDLSKVTGPYLHDWVDCGRVRIYHPRLRNDSFILRAVALGDPDGSDAYQLVHQLAACVIGGPDLNNAIAEANMSLESAQSRARVMLENDALILRLDLSADDYRKLADQVDHLAEAIDTLPSLQAIESMSRFQARWEPIPPSNPEPQAA